jgi:environmental stress-induced protein Ves
MRILPPEHARRVPWKNGRGSTLELATDATAPGEPWTWRLSIADVPERAPFSAFPGVDRWLVCVDGPGLRLLRGDAWQPVPRSGHGMAFCGEEEIEGEPLGPGVRDGNLFVLRSTWKGHLRLLHGVRGEHDGNSVFVQVGEQVEHIVTRGDVDAAGGFVHEQYSRPRDQRSGERYELALTA